MLSKSEKSYIRTSLLSEPPLRADGRSLLDFRGVAVELGVTALANGSARVRIGGDAGSESGGGGVCGTEVLVAVKVEVEDVSGSVDGGKGRMACNVSCSPAAYPSLTMLQLDDFQSDLTSILDTTLGCSSLCPTNLSIIPRKKAWLLHVDALVLADDGNVYDALFLAAAAALHDTRIPRTRPIEYRPNNARSQASADASDDPMDGASGLDTHAMPKATDFELMDYWDEGEPLVCPNGMSWPICVTLNLVPPLFYLDATTVEEDATLTRLLLLYSFSTNSSNTRLQGMRLLGHGEVEANLIKPLIREGEKHAKHLNQSLFAKLKSELTKRIPQIVPSTKRNK
ncbi:ribosomal protein S5 domain 2-like protein [Schizopora paradoxa]|uniref:Ribosomal RNA-processing protein 42 n=1 Tax=Schizopora paradoxa TaxID=27342 RepID=A0A0H2RJQ5_9AGAM|nr:ribosomal protein S5 domain 2-like protein [Schizopora paradoxa]